MSFLSWVPRLMQMKLNSIEYHQNIIENILKGNKFCFLKLHYDCFCGKRIRVVFLGFSILNNCEFSYVSSSIESHF